MRAFLHPLGLLVLGVGGIAALATFARGDWSGRGLLILAWTALGYTLLVGFEWLVSRRTSNVPSGTPAEADAGASTAPEAAGTQRPDHSAPDHSGRDDAHLPVQEALRRLNNPAALGDCALAFSLPHTIRALGPPLADSSDITVLYRARGLRAALVAAIDELRASGGDGSPQGDALRYTILYEEYVLGRPNTQIMIRHSISESTFHRYRREAARLLGDELARREQRLAVETNPISAVDSSS